MVNPQTCAPDTLALWNFLPGFCKYNDEMNGYQFLTWLDGIGQQQQLVDNLCQETPDFPGWSILLDVSRCPTYALPWLAQWVGVRFNRLQMGNDQAMRSAIIAKQGFARGTVAAIMAAAQPYVSATGYVNVIERYPDPYSLLVQIVGDLGSLTYGELGREYPTYPDVSDAFPDYDDFPEQNQDTVTAAIMAALPAGIVGTVVYL